MKNKNIMVVIETNHPHFDIIKNNFLTRTADESINSYDTYDIVMDLTILKTEKKILFLKELAKTTKAIIISDLTITYQEKVFHAIPQIKASVSSFFHSPTSTVEYFVHPSCTEDLNAFIDSFFARIGLKTFQTKNLQITFTMPRVVAQIINEAYFALEENLATASDIDSSMIHGVSYPIGPITWGQKSGNQNVLCILEELYSTTNDPRYRPSLALKKECLK